MSSKHLSTRHGDFEIRPYRPGDEVQITVGFNRVFGRTRGIAEWRAKFGNVGLERRIMVAVDRDAKIVAHYAATDATLEIEGTRFLAGQPVDVYSIRRPDVVMSGLFAKTTDFFFEAFCGAGKIALLYGFPGDRALRFGQLRNRYKHFKPVTVWTRPAAPAPPVRRLFGNRRELGQIDMFWKRTAHLSPAANRRDHLRLQRRYFGDRSQPYKFVTHARGGLLQAWAIFRVKGDTAYIAELMWDGEDLRSLEAVTGRIQLEAALANAAGLELWSPPGTYLAAGLSSLGWKSDRHPGGASLALMGFDPAIDEAWLLDNLFYSMGDSDLV